jgi:molybdopterin-guanine dinucleotide biosynthesis protein A
MLASLEPVHSEFILVLACDMPDIGRAVPALLDGPSAHPDADGVFAVDDERHPQPLAALYRTEKLRGALADRRRTSTLDGVSVRSLVARLHLEPVTVPGGSTNDVDTWADALRYGISGNSAAGDAGFAETVTAPALSASAPFHSLASDSRPSEEKP